MFCGVLGNVNDHPAMGVSGNTDWGTPINHTHGLSGTATSDAKTIDLHLL
jgi:hypothetical protein